MLSFHPPAPANWSSLLPSPLNRATRDPPLFLSPIRRRGALSSFHGLATPVDPNCEIHEGEYPAGGFWRRKECVHRGHWREGNSNSLAVYLYERGREQQMVVHARPGDGAVIVIRWQIVALLRYVWHPMDDRFRVTSIYSARLADLRQDEDGT